jgi:ABC-type nitrate/sulfonate/bicarbonate transport system substrate-binding protein
MNNSFPFTSPSRSIARIQRLLVAPLCVIGIALSATACQPAARADEEMRVATYGGILADLPVLVAESQGFFMEEGLPVKTIDFRSGSDAIAAVIGGGLDAAVSSPYAQILANKKSQNPSNTLVQVYGSQMIGSWGLLASDNLDLGDAAGVKEKVRALKGKTIGVPALGSEGHSLAMGIMAWAGIDPKVDVKFMAIGVGPDSRSSLKTGVIDAIMGTEPLVETLESEDGAQLIYHQAIHSDIPLLAPYPYATLVSKTGVANAKESQFHKFQKALDSSIEFIKDPANSGKVVEIWAAKSSADPALLASVLDKSRVTFSGEIDCRAIDNQIDLNLGIGTLQKGDYPGCRELAWTGISP